MKSFFPKFWPETLSMMPWMLPYRLGGGAQGVDPNRSLLSGDVIVGGFLNEPTGQGMGANLMLARFKAAGIPAKGFDAGYLHREAAASARDFWPENATSSGTAIFHINPDTLSSVFFDLGHSSLHQRRLVGYWVWESEQLSARWLRMFDMVDEIWVPTRFIADALQRAAPQKHICVVPYPFDVSSVPVTPRVDLLPQFAGRPVVLFAFDVGSSMARKNPEAVIEAFKKATEGNTEPVLVLKVKGEEKWPTSTELLNKAIGDATNIFVMRDALAPEQIKDLVARADIVMSLHRSEGFGFLMAEGMAAGKPVIATGWSGNIDYMSSSCCSYVNYKLVPVRDPQHIYDLPSAMWAEPDVDHAAVILRNLLQNPEERKSRGLAARKHIEAWASEENWFRSLPESFWLSLPIGTKERIIVER